MFWLLKIDPFCFYNKLHIADSAVNPQVSTQHLAHPQNNLVMDETFRSSLNARYAMDRYLSDPSHGYSQERVEDFGPGQSVRQNYRDYEKGKATTKHNISVSATDRDLWAKCNKLLRAEKKLSTLFITSTCIHLIVLVFVTISTANLASEKNNFRKFWIDMQRGYFSLLLEDHYPQVYPDQKYVYSSLVERLSSQEQVINHLKFAFEQFDNVMDESLARINKTFDNDGNVNYPHLCVTKRPPVNYHEEYTLRLDTECVDVYGDDDIDEALNHSISSAVHISMDFKFKQVYLIEGFKPLCINIDAHYTIENDVQHYLWPVRILAKGELISCLENSEEGDFLPLNNLAYFITTGAITAVVCVFGCIFHFVRLMTFFRIGKTVRNYANDKGCSKPLWASWPSRIQQLFRWKSKREIEEYADKQLYIPLKAYLIFCPPIHILDIIFMLLTISGVILVFTLLRSATTTDELISYSTSVSFVMGLCSIYFWCTSFRLLNYSKLAGVTVRSLFNSKATRSIFAAVVIASFAYIGIVLFAWVLLGIFHPNFSTFRLSAESFYSLLFGDEVITIFDGLIPEKTQYFVFVVSRVIIPIYGLLFPILLLSVVIAIVSVAAEQKYLPKEEVRQGKSNVDSDGVPTSGKYTWRVLLEWVTAPEPMPFPSSEANNMERGSFDCCDEGQLPNRSPQAQNNIYLQVLPSMDSRATLTTHEQHNPVSQLATATNSDCDSIRLSTRSENYCYPHDGLDMSEATSQQSSITVNMLGNTNDIVTNNKKDPSPASSLQATMVRHNRATITIPHTHPLSTQHTTFTGDETNV